MQGLIVGVHCHFRSYRLWRLAFSEMLSEVGKLINATFEESSRIQSDVAEVSCIQHYSQQLINALKKDTNSTGSLDLLKDIFSGFFWGSDFEERVGSQMVGIPATSSSTLTSELWDFSEDLNYPSGELLSPNYPDAYPIGVQYRWNITVSPRGVISLNFTHFDLGFSPHR